MTMSFDEIGKEVGVSGEQARLTYNLALQKMKVHMRTQEDWEKLLTLRTDTARIAEFIMAALDGGANLEKGLSQPRRVQARRASAFKMAYRKFVRGES